SESTKQVTVAAGTSQTVNFTITEAQPGTYNVNIGNQMGSFIVTGAGSKPSAEIGEGLLFAAAMAVIVMLVGLMIIIARRRFQGY
ncbi:MAG: hypothetical protein JXB43_01760, partial [Dehalococcoidia bacterium]|nr:hypothetical protein [Dehalococcoidia bacterium]